jgi:hypothetical protein
MMAERVAPIAATLIHWEGETKKLMSDIQEEAYTELCLENERLSKENKRLRELFEKDKDHRKLLTRAAEALAGSWYYNMSQERQTLNSILIAELRKAAVEKNE